MRPAHDETGVVVCCPDKFRGSLSAPEAAEAMCAGARRVGYEALAIPLADGGEGTLEALCRDPAEHRATRVSGPDGKPVDALWALRADGTAVIEMARASGLALVAGHNDVRAATTTGTGELIRRAIDGGAARIVVAVGGSATVDGGLGALTALGFDLHGADVVVACDVTTPFLDAPRIFGPQKGASSEDIAWLEARLELLADRYRDEFGVDVTGLPGAGAAGGLAGGLAALGARLEPGAPLVAAAVGLPARLREAALALTGEGKIDATSFAGKTVGTVVELAAASGVPVAAIAGQVEQSAVPEGLPTRSLVAYAGSEERAVADAFRLVAQASAELCGRL